MIVNINLSMERSPGGLQQLTEYHKVEIQRGRSRLGNYHGVPIRPLPTSISTTVQPDVPADDIKEVVALSLPAAVIASQATSNAGSTPPDVDGQLGRDVVTAKR